MTLELSDRDTNDAVTAVAQAFAKAFSGVTFSEATETTTLVMQSLQEFYPILDGLYQMRQEIKREYLAGRLAACGVPWSLARLITRKFPERMLPRWENVLHSGVDINSKLW